MKRHTLAHLLGFVVLLWLVAGVLRAAPVSLDQMREHVASFEGFRLVPYRDGASWSVGYGHNLSAHRQPVRPYNPAEVEQFLVHDMAVARDAARRGVERFDELPHPIQLLTIGVAMTVGPTGFHRFKAFRLALSRRAWGACVVELADSRWYQQVGSHRVNAYIRTLKAQAITSSP